MVARVLRDPAYTTPVHRADATRAHDHLDMLQTKLLNLIRFEIAKTTNLEKFHIRAVETLKTLLK